MKKRVKNILVIFGIIEFFLVCLYLCYQPECTPCAIIAPCSPCTSKQQKIIHILFFLPIILLFISVFSVFVGTSTTVETEELKTKKK